MTHNDRCLFLQDEIRTAFFDDFMVLPATHLMGNVYRPLDAPTERHDAMFAYVH